ncbi:hypothetical protein INT46_007691 [Mucor plumbeus]|uniref:Uncharacterized protein n=1 Tax=Mucor plumbeus TaxID=97098 RepID=A0A8H7UXD9_9FUNG|nr:hypothetical protein INT46_007691 [Mucor plumbeus]
MRRRRKRQLDIYIPGKTTINPPASFGDDGQGCLQSKRSTSNDKTNYMNALEAQFNIRISNSIKQCKSQDYDKLYEALLNGTRLSKRVVINAAESINVGAASIESFLRNECKKTKKKSVEYWTDYVRKNFITTKLSISNIEASISSTGNIRVDDDDDDSNDDVDEDEDEDDEDTGEYEEGTQYRACSASLRSVLRSDLSQQVQSLFASTINDNMQSVSDYLSDFSNQVFKMILIFNEYNFVLENHAVSLVAHEGNKISQVLLEGYLEKDASVAKPLDSKYLEDEEFKANYHKMFQDPHLELIHSTFYGAKGAQDSSLKTYPLHKAIVDVLGHDEVNLYKDLSSHVTKMARQLYYTNLHNMWSDNTIVNKLLTRLLRFLLIIHLCPDQDNDFKANKAKHQDKGKKATRRVTNCRIPEERISLLRMTRNGRRRLFANEEKKRIKYLQKGKELSASLCQRRLDTYRQVLEREREERDSGRKEKLEKKRGREGDNDDDVEDALVRDDINTEKTKDTPRRRIGQLLQVTRTALFQKQTVTRSYFEMKLKNLDDKEFETIIKIVNFVKPYIPDKDNYHHFQYQLPFVLMANQVLRSIGYDGQVITSSYGLEFVNRIHILHGQKTIRIYGALDYIQQRQKKPEAINKPIAQDKDEDDTLNALNNRRSILETLFKERRKELDQFILTAKSVRASKRDWKNKVADRDKYYREAEMTKLKKRELMVGIRNVRQDLQSLKRQIYEYRNPSTPLTSTTSPNPFIINSKPCHKKVEECMLDTDMNLDDVVFSGTDNGIIKTTETVYFDINRFTFHLELYNRFQILEDAMNTYDTYNLECMKLPLSLTIGPKEINQGSGLASYTKSIVQKKKSKIEGHAVLDEEEKLSNYSLYQCQTVGELQEAISHHCNAREKLRSFYYSNSQCKQRRRLELKKRRFYDKLAADERKSSSAKRPIMMIGDRGYGIGSRIKKHQRFGGHWKESRHGLYTPTLITNEYNSS